MQRKYEHSMEFLDTSIQELKLIRPVRHSDNRGFFMETYRKNMFDDNIGKIDFVQENESFSTKGVLRGLHLQVGDNAQAKLVRVIEGEVFDVAVDLREDSPTFGKWFGTVLSGENTLAMFIPRGFAHGFLVLSQYAHFLYKTDNYYHPESEATIAFDDPVIDIKWPGDPENYIISERDRKNALSFQQFKNLISNT